MYFFGKKINPEVMLPNVQCVYGGNTVTLVCKVLILVITMLLLKYIV